MSMMEHMKSFDTCTKDVSYRRRSVEIRIGKCSTSISGRVAKLAPIHRRARCKQTTAETFRMSGGKRSKKKWYLIYCSNCHQLSINDVLQRDQMNNYVFHYSRSHIFYVFARLSGSPNPISKFILYGIPVGTCNNKTGLEYLERTIDTRTVGEIRPMRASEWDPRGHSLSANIFQLHINDPLSCTFVYVDDSTR